MRCPKCKKQIPEKSLKCPFCHARAAVLCKKCNTYNSVTSLNCSNCHEVLLKVCPSCKSVNLPKAENCRKCGFDFSAPKTPAPKIQETTQERVIAEDLFSKPQISSAPQEISTPQPEPEQISIPESQPLNQEISEPEVVQPTQESEESEIAEEESKNIAFPPPELYSQQNAKEILMKGLTSTDKKIISLTGQKGVGKSVVLKSTIHELRDYGITWLIGECSPITQLSPCGLIQDILLTFFNITNVCSDSLRLKKESQKFFQDEFPTLTNEEIFNLLNLLYPTNTDYYENILSNKEKTFEFLKKVFQTILEKNRAVFIIENFDFIDGLSYEFLYKILNDKTFGQPFKILLTYNDTRPARGYLYVEDMTNNEYLDVSLKAFDKTQMGAFVDQYFQDEPCPEVLKGMMFSLSAGNPAVLEQAVNLLLDFKVKNNSLDLTFPSSFDGIVNMRLNFLRDNPSAYETLSVAAIQGIKFNPAIINQILDIEEEQFLAILDFLQRTNFIVQVNEFCYAFKSSMLWNSVLDEIKKDRNFVYFNENLYTAYSNYTLSSNSLMAVITQNLNQDVNAFKLWTDNIKIAAYIGDTNLYIISQKQCLILIDKIECANTELVRSNIYERLGKLLATLNPQEAIQYLPDAISNARRVQDNLKEIELTGYLASCCMKLSDYYGVIECVDSVVSKLSPDFDLELAMLKSRKLEALLNIGNSGEIINIVDNDIMPVFERYISSKPHKSIPVTSLYKTWLQTYLTLANALVFQGNSRSFDVLSTMFEIFEKNHFDDKLFICKTKLALALANTIKGEASLSEEILEDIIKTYKTEFMDNESISRWNLINILNNFIQHKYSGIQEELYQVVTFANNINDDFTKNILKTLLGKLFKDEGMAKQALDIYSEQITYFSKEKNALGALLTWYLMADATLIVEGPEKAIEIAQKALDVAQSTKINSYLFIVLYNKVIAEAYIVQAEYELAKAHIEKAVLVARKFELMELLTELYLIYGKYLQDIALVKTDGRADYVSGANKMYKKANLIAQEIKNNHLAAKIKTAQNALFSFCQLNKIHISEE